MAELIVALDTPDVSRIRRLVDQIGDRVSWYKIGSAVFTLCGPDLVGELKSRGRSIFLDLKYFDIPHQVEEAVCSLGTTGADLATVHILGGEDMLRAASRARLRCAASTRLVGVTLLTSLRERDLEFLGITGPLENLVLRLAALGKTCGLDGIVCSAEELPSLRGQFPPPFVIVCPGIRLDRSPDDQKRVASPAFATRNGADFLVVGRPVTSAPDPRKAVDEILREVERASESMD